MGELWFIGLGLGDERDLSIRARERLAQAEAIFAEEYTSQLASGAMERLGRELGRPIRRLTREELESERPVREALDRHGQVALLVAGDPFVATTHVALRVAVEGWGHTWQYLPNASVLTAVPGLLGLMPYRFGRTVSLPFPAPGFAPRSPLEGVAENRSRGLHTLVLLDLRPEEGRFLGAAEAIRILTERDVGAPPVLPPELEVGVVARAGTPDGRAWFGRRGDLARIDFGAPMHALVIPAAELHFQEAAAVKRWRIGAP